MSFRKFFNTGRKRKPTQPKRSRSRGLLWLVGCLAVALLAVWGYQQRAHIGSTLVEFMAEAVDARLGQLPVEGLRYTDPAALKMAISLQKGDSLVNFNSAQTRARIEALPWVRLATVARQLPSTVRVELFEYRPVARLLVGGQTYAVDVSGNLITPVGEGFEELPLVGGTGAAEQASLLLAMLAARPELDGLLEVATYIGNRRWDLTFKNNVTARLPEENPARALAILVKLDAERDVFAMADTVIDLRLEDRIILKLPKQP